MGKKQWDREVERIHKRVLELLQEYENIFQEPYQGFFFDEFHKAYKAGFCGPLRYRLFSDSDRIEWIKSKPKISGDSIWRYAKEQGWVHSEMTGEEKEYRRIEAVRSWWDAWTYAFHKLGHKHCRHGKMEKDPRGKTTFSVLGVRP